jgi:uncharacterized membrane protein YgdD (TMEM256/DUF423 family)
LHQRLFYFKEITMSPTMMIQFAALSGFFSVALGAFGAHGLKAKLSPEMMAIYQTAVQYQFVHTLALLFVGVLMVQWGKSTALQVSAWGFMAGIAIFSGSLYALSLSGVRWLGAITPLGGVAFLVAWAGLLIAAYKVS